MAINVTLNTYDLSIEEVGGDLIDTIAYQTIDTIAYTYNPGTVVVASTLGAAPTVTGTPQWFAVIWVRDGRKAVIQLGDVANQAGWTNDQAGFDQAVADIYAAFPAGGGGGGTGTVTSVDADGGTTGYAFTGGPVTASGTLTMEVDDAGVARESIKAADYYPTFTFSTNTTTNANPGAGFFRFNNATIASVTEFSCSGIAHFEGGDQSVETWLYSWGDALILKRTDVGETDDIIILALRTQLVLSPYLRTEASLTTTIIGGVANATPPNNSNWRVVSVGDGSINANVQAQLDGKANTHRINGTASPTAIIDVRTGTTDVVGDVAFNMSAYSSVTLLSGLSYDTYAAQPIVVDGTLATFTLNFIQATDGLPLEGSIIATFLCVP